MPPDADDVVPWTVAPQHRWAYPLSMLRVDARERAGDPLQPIERQRLASWLANLGDGDLVVSYDPDSAEGFGYSLRRPGIDTDLVRVPDAPT